MELQYDADWLAADIGRPLSLSLPFNLQNLQAKGEKVANYFDNLLPDSEVLRLTGMCRSALYDQMARGQFPGSIKIGERATSWSAKAVRNWIAPRVDGL